MDFGISRDASTLDGERLVLSLLSLSRLSSGSGVGSFRDPLTPGLYPLSRRHHPSAITEIASPFRFLPPHSRRGNIEHVQQTSK